MSLDSMLIHTCTIENPAAGALNAYNNEVKAYATAVSGVRCRLIENKEEVKGDEVSEPFIKTTYLLIVNRTVDLQEKAKISSVTLEDGTTTTDTFEVSSVLNRRGGKSLQHKSAMLERIS